MENRVFKEGERVKVAAIWYSEEKECCCKEEVEAMVQIRCLDTRFIPAGDKSNDVYLKFDRSMQGYDGLLANLLGWQPNWVGERFRDQLILCMATDEEILAAQKMFAEKARIRSQEYKAYARTWANVSENCMKLHDTAED